MQREYQSPVLRELRDQQIRFAPRPKKLQQVEAAERLIAEIDAEKTYPYEYVCFRITGYRPTEPAPTKITGDDLRHDLRLFVEDLSDSADMTADNIGEQVLTVEELAKQFNVSTKTISRWRELGLVSRRLVFDGRKRVGFLRSSVDRFVKTQPRASRSRCAVQPAHRRTATGHHRPCPPPGERRWRPVGDFAPAGEAGRPQRRDDSFDDPAVRQAASGTGDLSRI